MSTPGASLYTATENKQGSSRGFVSPELINIGLMVFTPACISPTPGSAVVEVWQRKGRVPSLSSANCFQCSVDRFDILLQLPVFLRLFNIVGILLCAPAY